MVFLVLCVSYLVLLFTRACTRFVVAPLACTNMLLLLLLCTTATEY